MRKEISIEKVRTAILSLQTSGVKESAQVVWDLLDNYVSQPAQPLVFPSTSALEDALAGGFGAQNPIYVQNVLAKRDAERAQRGASAWSNFPKCRVTDYMGGDVPCSTPAIGHLVVSKTDRSYPMCDTHGENLNSPGYADWVQTFFGDENSAADVAKLAVAMEEKASECEAEPEILHCLAATLYVNAPELHGKCSRPAVGYLNNGKSGIDTDACLDCGQSFADKHKRRGYTFTLYSEETGE